MPFQKNDIQTLGQGEAVKPPTIAARSTDIDLFGRETVGLSTPIAEELHAHFERGGSVAEGVQLVAALERAVARRSAIEAPSKQSAARGTRLFAGWEPSTLDVQFALDRGLPRTRLFNETEKFRNYWTAKSGVSASKRDWSATWRNWIINTMERFENEWSGQNYGTISPPRGTRTGSHAILAGVAAAADRRARERMSAGQHGQSPPHGGPAPNDDLELIGKGRR
jgi:hypothetical protein